MNDKFQVIDALKSDLLVFENYAKFDVHCLDSVKIKNAIQKGDDILPPSVRFDTLDAKVDNPFMWSGQEESTTEYALTQKYDNQLKQAKEVLSLAYNDYRKDDVDFNKMRHKSINQSTVFDAKLNKFTLVNNKYDLRDPTPTAAGGGANSKQPELQRNGSKLTNGSNEFKKSKTAGGLENEDFFEKKYN